jgi:hypothetical protein
MLKVNNLLHTYSSKPVLNTTRDAVIVALITVTIMIIITALYYLVTGDIKYTLTLDYWKGMGRSFLTSFILCYAYEYSGLNARLSADSMRYAKGSMLNKYETRNAALIAEKTADILAKAVTSGGADIGAIKANAEKLRLMARSTREHKLILRGAENKTPIEDIHRSLATRYQTQLTPADVTALMNLEDGATDNIERLAAVPRLLELLGANDALLEYFIKNGFSKLSAAKVKNNWTLDVAALSAKTGVPVRTIGLGSSPGSAQAVSNSLGTAVTI